MVKTHWTFSPDQITDKLWREAEELDLRLKYVPETPEEVAYYEIDTYPVFDPIAAEFDRKVRS